MEKMKNNQASEKFQDFIDLSTIVCHSSGKDRESVICELIALAAQQNPSLDCEVVKKSVLAREALFSTVIAPGLAMPHCRVAGLDKVIVAMATSRCGVKFGEGDGENVKVAVLVLAPVDEPLLHLRAVAALAREFSDPEKVKAVAELETAEEIVKFFRVMPMRLPEYLCAGDLAESAGPVMLADDTLAFAFRKFAESNAELLPVLDDQGSLKGVIRLKNILKYNIPLNLLEKDDLSELYDLRPYSDVISRAESIKVADVMSVNYETVTEDLPAAKLIKLFLGTPEREVLVVDPENHLRGEIKLRDFAAKIFWK